MDDFLGSVDSGADSFGSGGGGFGSTDNLDTFGASSFGGSDAGDQFQPTGAASSNGAASGDSNGSANVLVKWRREHEDFLDEKRKARVAQQDEVRSQAQRELDEFYAKRAAKKEQRAAENRRAEEEFCRQRDAVLAGSGSEWERAATLVDFKNPPVGRDTSRLKSLMISLKQKS